MFDVVEVIAKINYWVQDNKSKNNRKGRRLFGIYALLLSYSYSMG